MRNLFMSAPFCIVWFWWNGFICRESIRFGEINWCVWVWQTRHTLQTTKSHYTNLIWIAEESVWSQIVNTLMLFRFKWFGWSSCVRRRRHRRHLLSYSKWQGFTQRLFRLVRASVHSRCCCYCCHRLLWECVRVLYASPCLIQHQDNVCIII